MRPKKQGTKKKNASKPNVSAEEMEYRKSKFPEPLIILQIMIRCSACGQQMNSDIERGSFRLHPFLETLVCEKCTAFYGDGNFEPDGDGTDKFCRMCGEGGSLFMCDTCICGFCERCINQNMDRRYRRFVDKSPWLCPCCDPKPMFFPRATAWAVLQFLEKYGPEEASKYVTLGSSFEQEKLLMEMRTAQG